MPHIRRRQGFGCGQAAGYTGYTGYTGYALVISLFQPSRPSFFIVSMFFS